MGSRYPIGRSVEKVQCYRIESWSSIGVLSKKYILAGVFQTFNWIEVRALDRRETHQTEMNKLSGISLWCPKKSISSRELSSRTPKISWRFELYFIINLGIDPFLLSNRNNNTYNYKYFPKNSTLSNHSARWRAQHSFMGSDSTSIVIPLLVLCIR